LNNANTTDWEEIRSNYPACLNQTYLLSASVGPLHKKVYNAWLKSLENLHLNGDIHWQDNLVTREECRQAAARLLEAQPADIGFSPNTSHSMNLLAMVLAQDKRGTIISIADEFPSTVLGWYQQGFNVNKLATDNGYISVEDILAAIDHETVAVVVSAVQFITGLRLDIVTLGKYLAQRKIPFIVNATQMLGTFPLSVADGNITALTASCHKWVGAGFSGSLLYTNPQFRKQHKWPPLAGWLSVKDLGLMSNEPQELNPDCAAIETGVLPFTALAGLKAAIEVILDIGIINIAERIFYLSDYLVGQLRELPVKMLTPRDEESDFRKSVNSGIVSLAIENPEELEAALTKRNIHVSARRNGVRIAVHHYNNEKDIDTLITVLKEFF
jgi:cysteine desulfurase/selenocysteine lyase